MEFEFWWLIALPVFFALGWIAARIDIRLLVNESRQLPDNYFKGLNFLLNNENDKAIDAFVEIVKLDPETTELHFALGNLFRRRGETDRAIRMHQHLLQRDDLPEDLQFKARYELGQDFLKAGLLDRAETMFLSLTNTTYDITARRALLEIFQREKEWRQAIEMAEGLQNSGTGARATQISQFYCELASDELVARRPEGALPLLETARSIDRQNIRATILTGDALKALGKPEEAIDTWRRVENQNVEYTSLVANRLMTTYTELNREAEGISLLRSYLAQSPSIDVLDVVYKALVKTEGSSAADAIVTAELKRTPTLLGLERQFEARMLTAPEEYREDITFARTLVGRYSARLSRYQCSHCGFEARQFYWQCPGCYTWGAYAPKRMEEMNAATRI